MAEQPRGAPGRDAASVGAEATLSIGELAELIRGALAAAAPAALWVHGEVASVRVSRAGHTYLDLVEHADGATRARITGVIWRSARRRIDAALAHAGDLRLEEGVALRLRVRLDFYPPQGALQVIVEAVDPAFTLGALAAARERLLRTLHAEGLLAANAALDLPVAPLRIGLVTSAGSAACEDFCAELAASGIAFEVRLAHAQVQGADAARSVVAALRALAVDPPDVVAVVRGGGARTDLAGFDAEAVARAIAAMPVPVLTGLGHEIDRSVADEVAAMACKTPTACAQTLVERVRGVAAHAERTFAELAAHAERTFAEQRRTLTDRQARIAAAARGGLRRAAGELAARGRRLPVLTERLLAERQRRLSEAERYARSHDPARLLARGFSLTRDAAGRLLVDADAVAAGDALVTTLARGQVHSVVRDGAPGDGASGDGPSGDDRGDSEGGDG